MDILIAIAILYLLLRTLSKYLLPYLVKRYLKKVKTRFEENQRPNSQTKESSNKINIKYPGRNQSNSEPEYTPFEEIIDEKSSETNK